MGYATCPNQITYVGPRGIIEKDEDSIGFGGDMFLEPYDEDKAKELISKWDEICTKKIGEAYDELMEYKNKKGY